MTYIAEGINTGENSNNDLFARKLSGRIGLDLFCVATSVNLSHSIKDNAAEATQFRQ